MIGSDAFYVRLYFHFGTITWVNIRLSKFSICIDIVEVWFGIANGQILSVFDTVICLQHNNGRLLSFHVFCLHITIYIFTQMQKETSTLIQTLSRILQHLTTMSTNTLTPPSMGKPAIQSHSSLSTAITNLEILSILSIQTKQEEIWCYPLHWHQISVLIRILCVCMQFFIHIICKVGKRNANCEGQDELAHWCNLI